MRYTIDYGETWETLNPTFGTEAPKDYAEKAAYHEYFRQEGREIHFPLEILVIDFQGMWHDFLVYDRETGASIPELHAEEVE